MTTSNNITWELNRNGIIEAAYRKLGIPGEDNTLSTVQYTDGATALNGVIALAVTDGMALWKRTTVSQTPSITSQVYTITGAVKIADVILADTSGVRYSLQPKSLYDFKRLPTGSSGIPVAWTAQPTISGATVSIWPLTADSSTVTTKTIDVVYQKKFDGVFAATDTLDFPSYWMLALVYKTAVLLAPEHGVPLEDRRMLLQEANIYWAQASSYGDEDGSIFFQAADV